MGGPCLRRVGDRNERDVRFAIPSTVGDNGEIVCPHGVGKGKAAVVVGNGMIDPLLMLGLIGGPDDRRRVDIVRHNVEETLTTQ